MKMIYIKFCVSWLLILYDGFYFFGYYVKMDLILFDLCFVGWSSRGSLDRYNSYFYFQSLFLFIFQDGLFNGLFYLDIIRRFYYQLYRLFNYGIFEFLYLDKDFKELLAEDIYIYLKYDSIISKDFLERFRYDSKGLLDRFSKYELLNDLY